MKFNSYLKTKVLEKLQLNLINFNKIELNNLTIKNYPPSPFIPTKYSSHLIGIS